MSGAAEILRASLAVGEQAEQEAEAVKAAAVENAQAEADRMMGDAHRQIQALQQSIDTLAVRRANVVSELGRLQKYLAAAAPGGEARDAEIDVDVDEDEDDEMTEPMSAAPDPRPSSKNGDRSVAQSRLNRSDPGAGDPRRSAQRQLARHERRRQCRVTHDEAVDARRRTTGPRRWPTR